MDLARAVMIVYNNEEASAEDKKEALEMVLKGFEKQDKAFAVWKKINQELRLEARKPINDATKGYNLALKKAIDIVNQCFNEVMENEN